MGSILTVLTAEERNCAEKIMIQDLSFIDLGWQKIVWPDIETVKEDGFTNHLVTYLPICYMRVWGLEKITFYFLPNPPGLAKL